MVTQRPELNQTLLVVHYLVSSAGFAVKSQVLAILLPAYFLYLLSLFGEHVGFRSSREESLTFLEIANVQPILFVGL